ncbi:uncharacterized protein LOC116923613 [Daphnia magna]|uniref:DUF3730 domain-containing protein n=2 Tax=Daphnia magna TaxID=35525 RepID=A0ABQ9Z7T6_9CRUS|nr:uncharacterized protein LOC116923613 [Daphnia magna]XP_032785975.2 uncharacterized protein LOC116923613 [Daphnia magna]KAK4008958.1 hypothetical protein OUZ56_014077 [Daphnia magna]
MERNVDALLLNNIVDSLRSSDVDSISSTCEFLETVVIYDFPAEAFLHQRELLVCLLKLCQDVDPVIADAACSCFDSICKRIVTQFKRKEKPSWITVVKLITESSSARDPGDGIENSLLTLSNLSVMIAKACHQMLIRSSKPFDHILKLLNTASALSGIVKSPTENMEFYQILTSISAALRASSRQNFATFLLLLVTSIQSCPVSSLSTDVVYEIYNGLLDASITHYHPELLEKCIAVLKENRPLHDKYEKISNLYVAFQNLAKFLKNSDQEYDLVPVIYLLKLDDALTESLLPWVFKHLKEFGGKPAITMTLLLLSQKEPILGQIYQLLAEIASPMKSINIGPHIGDLFVDEAVVRAIAKGMCSESAQIAPIAEKILALILKGRVWMNDQQWQTLVTTIIPKLILDIEPNIQHFKILRPLLWDLINQSHCTSDDADGCPRLDLNFVLRFLIRNMSNQDILRDKSSLSLISILCQQPQAHLLRPRISALDPSSLSEIFSGDLTVAIESTAKFGVSTLTETMQALKGADLVMAWTHLTKLAIILEDKDLHQIFLDNGGIPILVDFLHKSLVVSENEPFLSVMLAIVKTFLFVAHMNPAAKNALAWDNDFMMDLLRATMMTRQDLIARRHCVALLRLLAIEENPPPPEPVIEESIDSAGWYEMWSKAVVRWSAKFIFNAELSTPPSVPSVPPFLKLSPAELEVGTSANDCALVEQALSRICNAEGHHDVSEALTLLREVLQRINLLPEVFDLEWQESLETFFTVHPESTSDEKVFTSILEMLMLSLAQMEKLENVEEFCLFSWLRSIMVDGKHVFWILFQDRCQQFNKADNDSHLLPFLLRFVSATVRLIGSHTPSGSLAHVLEILCKTFEQDNQSQVYQLNSLKLILECTVHTAAAILKWKPASVDQAIIASLLKHATATLVSFSSKTHSNKGRSVVQCCSQLINVLIALSQYCSSSCVHLSDLDWLIVLLQHPDPTVKTAGINTCTQLSRNVHITDDVAETVLSFLFNTDENCSVVEQACLLLSQHASRMTDQAVRQVVLMASSSRICLNQSLLRALLQLLINCTHVQAASAHVTAIVNDLIPILPSLLNNEDTIPDVKAAVLCLLYRIALLQPKIAVWLLNEFECVTTAVQSLFCDNENLVGEAALFVTFLLQTEGQSSNKVFQVVFHSVPQLWDLFFFLSDRTLSHPAARRVLLFIQTVLTAAVKSNRNLQLDPVYVQHFCQWLIPHLPAKIDNSLRQSVLQALGLLLLCCSTPTKDTVKLTSEFIIKELQLCLSRSSDKYIAALLSLAHNFVLRHPEAEQELLKSGIFPPIIEIWKTRSSRETNVSVLLYMINFEKILVGKETLKEVRVLLKLMMEYLEEKEAVIARQSMPVSDEDWNIIESIHELLLASVSSLECRRILAKYKYWNSIAQTWHPVYLKRIINRHQHGSLTTLIRLRARLLSALTVFPEPALPDLMDSKVAETLVDVISQPYGAEKHALSILRNMAFHNNYKTPLLSASNVLPLFVRLLTSKAAIDDVTSSTMAVTALISLASNNQRVKSDVRAMTAAWFQRNPLVIKKDTTKFQSLCLNLQKLIDV